MLNFFGSVLSEARVQRSETNAFCRAFLIHNSGRPDTIRPHQSHNPIPPMSRFTFFQQRDEQQGAPLFPAWLARYTYTQLHLCFAQSHLLVHLKMRLWIQTKMEALKLSDPIEAFAFLSDLNKILICPDGKIMLADDDVRILTPLFRDIHRYVLLVLNPPLMSLPSMTDNTLPFMQREENLFATCSSHYRMLTVQKTDLPHEFLFASIAETTSCITVPKEGSLNTTLMTMLSELTELARATKADLAEVTLLQHEIRTLLETLKPAEAISLQKGLTLLLSICATAEIAITTPETRLRPPL